MSKQKPNKEILSIDHEDDQENYDKFSKFLEDHTSRVKKKQANEIFEMGETLLSQIDHKKRVKDKEKTKLIKYIIKKSNKYDEQYLLDLDYNDVKDIFDEIKYQNRSFFKKILEIFN